MAKQSRTVYHVYVNVQSLDESLNVAHHKVDFDKAKEIARGHIASLFGPAFAESLEMATVGYTDLTIIWKHQESAQLFVDAVRDVFPAGRDYWQEENLVRNVYGQLVTEEYDAKNDIWDQIDTGDILIPWKDQKAEA